MMFLRFAAVCTALLQASASDVSPYHSPLSLRLNDRKVIAQPQRAESRLDSAGSSFRIQGGIEDGGSAELLVIPKDAKGKDILLAVDVQVEKMGPREQDMWIRRVQVHGAWLHGKKWGFKTGSAAYGSPELYLAKYGDSEWTAPVNLLKASDGLLSVAIHDKPVPTQIFQSSTAMDTQLVVGPVVVGVVWKTSNKDGLNFNHLDVHLAGLSSVEQTLGGLLIGDPEEKAPPSNATQAESPEQESPTEGSPDQSVLTQVPVKASPKDWLEKVPEAIFAALKSDVSSDYH